MRSVVLGKTGLVVSAVGFGGIPIQRLSEDTAVAVVTRALDLGVTFIDTAAAYTDSQTKIGKAIAGRRAGLVLASKSLARTKDELLADIARARAALGVECIDLFQFHGVSTPEAWDTIRGPGGALEGMLEARERGHIHHIGFTSHSLDLALELVHEPIFETVQFPFNLVTAEPADALIPLAREHNLGFIVMKPLCGGQFDDAGLAFRFLNAFPDIVPIPGIEQVAEIEEIVALVASGETLVGNDKARADVIIAELGKQFCRRCMYCEPCPQGVPVHLAMIFDSFVKRTPAHMVATGVGALIAEKVGLCTECGICETKCPYELPIRATIKVSLAKAKAIRAEVLGE
jgi:uncharacterized protein